MDGLLIRIEVAKFIFTQKLFQTYGFDSRARRRRIPKIKNGA